SYSDPVVIEPRPIPVVDDPDASGGNDYAAAVRGNPWDFNTPDDALAVQNATNVSFSGGALNATNGPPTRNDPQVQLPLGPSGIEGTRFHRLSFSYRYDGPFGLEDAPGGGTIARLIWQVDGGGPLDYQDLNDLVTYEGTNRVVFDMASGGSILDEDQRGARLGWAGRTITSLRFDPNEDPGGRSWHLEDLRLAEDDTGVGAFDVTFHDQAWVPGTRADVFYDTDNRGFDGQLIASDVAVAQGANVVRWTAGGVAPGTYFIYVVLRHADSTARAYSGGPVALRAVGRLAGADRIETALETAQSTYAAGTAGAVVLARYDNFPDALAGTPLAGAKDGPLLLTPPASLDQRVGGLIERLLPSGRTVYLLGGEAALSAQVESQVRALGYQTVRLAGGDRYETAVKVAEAIGNPVELFLTTGTNFPDALSAGPAAIKQKGAILLTAGPAMPPSTAAYIQGRPSGRRYAVGSQAAAADPAATSLSGTDRFATSRLVAERFFVNPGKVGVASGVNFPDALAGGAHAAKLGAPLVLSLPGGLPPTIRDYLVANRASLAGGVLYGGEVALSDAVRAGVESAIA
ncbi:MAG: cell wall-binding repeat-containing protein, partial [Actinobacteria bacterium]|nr:cell wall-binding repeat-containing protein [Actinomycetota bacterium]